MLIPSTSKRSGLVLALTILLACSTTKTTLAFSISPSSCTTMTTTSTRNIRTNILKETMTGTRTQLYSSLDDGPPPQTFRDAEILGLQLMQEGQHEKALKVFQQALKLPGSRKDIIRTKTLSGPSPVGGSAGGTEGKQVMTLDEFEMQAAHYNIACAYARLDMISQSCKSLEMAFKVGFDNYATVRADPDLNSVHNTPEFEALMEKFDPKKGFPNPFALFN